MAIKKGAFELYATKRQLPNKTNELLQRKSHFFDNVIGNENSSKLTNDQLTIVSSVTSYFDDQGTKHERLKGTLTVHERFTEQATLLSSDINTLDTHRVQSEPINGTQTVHERFTEQATLVLSDINLLNNYRVQPESGNGIQMVSNQHVRDDNQLRENSYSERDQKRSIISFSRLIGNQRNVVIAFYKSIQMNDYLTTRELTLDEIAISAGVNKKSLKNTLFRLSNAGFIIRAEQKVGRGGWVKYQLNQDLKNEIDNISIYSGARKK